MSAPLVTAQHVFDYSLPGQKNVLLSQLGQLTQALRSQCQAADGFGQETTTSRSPLPTTSRSTNG